jgi:hypothetical protein
VAERGELGEVVRVDDNGRRKVSFPKVGPWFEHVRIMFHIVSLAWMNLGWARQKATTACNCSVSSGFWTTLIADIVFQYCAV